MRTIKIKPTPDQARFHALQCKYPAFVGGFGVGKSETMANQAFMDATHSPNALIGLYEPTYDLVRLIMAPRMEEKLIDFGVRYKYNKSENVIYTSSNQIGDFILRTLDNPARIVGYQTYRSHVDEIDTLKEDHAREAWNKIIARNRQSIGENSFNRVSAYTTPEGFRFVYKRWVKQRSAMYEMVQASTLGNPFLPEDYVDSLRETYPDNLIEAYINGDFVNLSSGTVYPQFSRAENNSDEEYQQGESIYIGMDFNVGRMCAVVYVQRNGKAHAVDEFINAYDTPNMIQLIKQKYWRETSQGEFDKLNNIYIYPDSTGKNRKSVGAGETDISLLKSAGFTVKAKTQNPPVKDRVNAMNAALCNSKGERVLFVNTRLCPHYTEKLEQQVYNDRGEPEKDGTEDVNDAGGYYIAYEYPIIKPMWTGGFKMR